MWLKFKGPKRRRLWSSMVIVMVRSQNSEVDWLLSLFWPNLEVRSPRVLMLIKCGSRESRRTDQRPYVSLKGATGSRRDGNAHAWSTLRLVLIGFPSKRRLKLIALF